MSEGAENLPKNPENVTSSFSSKCKEMAKYTAKYMGVGVPVQLGVALSTRVVLGALGVNLDPILVPISAPASMMITRAILDRKNHHEL